RAVPADRERQGDAAPRAGPRRGTPGCRGAGNGPVEGWAPRTSGGRPARADMAAARQARASAAAGREPDRVVAWAVDRVAALAEIPAAVPAAIPDAAPAATPAADPKLRPAAATDCRVANQSRLDRVGPTSGRVAALQPHAP